MDHYSDDETTQHSDLEYLHINGEEPQKFKQTTPAPTVQTENSDSVVPESPAPARRERSSTTFSDVDKPKEAPKVDVSLPADPYAYMTPRLRSLILWENPTVSGSTLAGALSLLMVCRWVSLFKLTCALSVFGVMASFVYVNALLVFNRITGRTDAIRPLEQYYSRSTKYLHIEADGLHRKVDYVTDGLNVILRELAKVILIQDNKKSLKFVGLSYLLWTLRTWFSTTTLLSLLIISIFAAPRLYLDNQTLIDAKVAQGTAAVQVHVQAGQKVLNQHLSKGTETVTTLLREKGLLKAPQTPVVAKEVKVE